MQPSGSVNLTGMSMQQLVTPIYNCFLYVSSLGNSLKSTESTLMSKLDETTKVPWRPLQKQHGTRKPAKT
jgi:hypothetical protein